MMTYLDIRISYSKMNTLWKNRWIEALRSGRYKQGHGVLRQGDEFCCLGVICDLCAPSEWHSSTILKKNGYRHGPYSYGFPAKVIADEVGLSQEAASHLSTLNDIDMASFGTIADWIEKNL